MDNLRLTLIGVEYKNDALRQKVPVDSPREIFCTPGSVSTNEWASAGTMGLRAEHRLEVYADEYRGEERCSYMGREYSIYRTYRRTPDAPMIELYLGTRTGVQ